MKWAFPQENQAHRAWMPPPPVGWWAPLFGTLQAMCWRSVGGL